MRFQTFCIILAMSCGPIAAQDVAVATLEEGEQHSPIVLQNMTGRTTSGGAAEGARYLSLTPESDEVGAALLRLRLGEAVTPAGREALSAMLRVTSAEPEVELRWVAVDAQKRLTFQRRFTLKAGDQWVRLEEPLRTWRWDHRRVGDWDEVKELALVVASPGVERIDLDDVRLTGRTTEADRTAWLLGVAFAGRPYEHVSADGMIVATDALKPFADADLQALLADMRRARAFVRRAFDETVRPTDQHDAPIALFIFEDRGDFSKLFERLGAQWRVTVAPPQAQGYTIQDIAASTYDPKLGTRRPVYLHEAVHAIVARDLRLVVGNPSHWPLQEGIANYVQLCMFPQSIDPSAYLKAFAEVDPAGTGFFKPLDALFASQGTTREYAQLASVVAYLLERDLPLLRSLANGLADGRTAADIVEKHGTTWPKVQDAWMEWGRARFTNDLPRDAPAFDPPMELK